MDKLLAELQAPPRNNDKLYAVAMIKAIRGQMNEAFEIFDKLAEEKYGLLVYMKVQKEFYPFNNEPRYYKLLQKIGFE